VQDTRAVLSPIETLNLQELVHTFTLLCSDGFVENFGPALIARAAAEAPGVRLRFIQKSDKDNTALRDTSVDLETGVVGNTTSPEVRTRVLFEDHFIGVVRQGHALCESDITPARYAAGRHILVSRRGRFRGPVDDALQSMGLQREIATIVGGFSAALALARGSDLIATVPARHSGNLRAGLHSFPLPFTIEPIMVSMLWHPRMDAELAHRWLRGLLLEICAPPA